MATWQYELVDPPTEPRALELWLQHAAGFIFFQDIRQYARESIEAGLSEEARAAAEKGIDDALYGLMTVIEGMSGGLSNARFDVVTETIVRLTRRADGEVLSEINLEDGDGMCMGYHGWRAGDFGRDPVAVPKAQRDSGSSG